MHIIKQKNRDTAFKSIRKSTYAYNKINNRGKIKAWVQSHCLY